MLGNQLKVLWRNLLGNRVYTLLNVIGLAVGIAASTLIGLYVIDELSYDNYHEKKDRIYRLTTTLDLGGDMQAAVTNMAVGPTLKRDYPLVENYVRFFGGGGEVELTVDNTVYKTDNIRFTDSTLFDVFTYEFIQGDPKDALKAPNTVVLTKTLALKVFGATDVLNKQLKMNNSMLRVTGVIEDVKPNSEMQFKAVVSMSTLPQQTRDVFTQDWFRIGVFTFILMKETIDPYDFEDELDEVNEKYVLPWGQANGSEASHDFRLTALKDVHFDNRHEYDLPKGKKSTLYIFVLLGFFLLLIAAFNFINLSLAQQRKRSKEVGVRKTLGASNSSIMRQFILESCLLTAVSMLIGLMLTEIFLEQFNQVSGKYIVAWDVFTPKVLAIELGIFVFIALLSGAYPAFILSNLKPTTVLKGTQQKEGSVGLFRKLLIGLQFLFSIFMITGSFLVGDQLEYIRSKNLGFDKENLVTVTLPSDTTARKNALPWIDLLKNDDRIKSYSRSNLPTGGSPEIMFRIEDGERLQERTVKCLFVDEYFAEVLGLKLTQGRFFSSKFPTDAQQGFIVNQTAVKEFGWEDEPLNKRVQWGLLADNQAENDGKVIGVIDDFNFQSLHNKLEPLILLYNPSLQGGTTVSIRFKEGDYTKTLSYLEEEWNKTVKTHAFDLSFYDQDIAENYRDENKLFTIFMFFSAVSIILASFGLFSILSYSIQARSKEIGIRKVLGATDVQVMWIIAKDFVWLMIGAFVLATPVVYFLWSSWLDDFAYHTNLQIGSLILSLLIALVLVLITVIYHGIKVSKSNPIDTIRVE
ncbi:putative ABC transport system permease protein [Lishizhenia tianjinensis]|uniref:Putative ABC transport system permease protein n=1 Tax=Lishizhenia tianjinensis TaxID=477690 RepID=A0A1I6YLG4_9FLAO|nr:ABC transporter permease [Lishizhenia tianjinensis]SFT51158.1 putative ABC transport system permease protein [Lishizhenia tianjinensis]